MQMSSSNCFDRNSIISEDVESPLLISMCPEYALYFDKKLPLAALQALIPIQMTYGSWFRLERRSDKKTDYHRQAIHMRQWVVNVTDRIHAMWKCDATQHWILEGVTDAFTGRPLWEWMHPRVKWDRSVD